MVDPLQAVLEAFQADQTGAQSHGGPFCHMALLNLAVLLLRPPHPENPQGTEIAGPVHIWDSGQGRKIRLEQQQPGFSRLPTQTSDDEAIILRVGQAWQLRGVICNSFCRWKLFTIP